MQQLINTLRICFTPIAPWHWGQTAAQLRRGIGWEPPMMMIAALGIILPLNVVIGILGNNRFAATFSLATTISWLVVSLIATGLVVTGCLRNIRRYGVFGYTRTNWWFECGRLAVIICLFAVVACPAACFLPWQDTTLPILLATAAVSSLLFIVTSTAGYIIRYVKQSRPTSKAFQCVHYFYNLLVPLALLIGSALCWPQNVLWPNGVLVLCAGLGSTVPCAAGILTIVNHYTEWETSRTD